ncbi:MAG: PAS domain-containing protein [Hymenobacter sp.]
MLLIDHHGIIALVNPVACLLLGQPAKELLDQPGRRRGPAQRDAARVAARPRRARRRPYPPPRPKPAGPPAPCLRCGRTAKTCITSSR